MTDPVLPLAVIILAAGQGTRMRSDTHKVLHPIAGKAMLLHLLDTVSELSPAREVLVVGKGREQVEAMVAARGATIAVQGEQFGTAHAVAQGLPALDSFDGNILILFGDTPFVEAGTLRAMLSRLAAPDSPSIVVLAHTPVDPGAYGRVILGHGDLVAKMVEYKDATEAERAVRLCNSGMMALAATDLRRWLPQIGNDNAAGEYYLPDLVMVAAAEGIAAVAVEGAAIEAVGINSRAELAAAEGQWQQRRRMQMMAAGVSLIDPASVWFAADTVIGRDVTIEPHVFFGPGVTIADGAIIRAFSHIEGASVGPGCEVGPFARLRPGAVMEEGSKIGNFVEMKKARLGPGAKANHLTYLGDADVGANANIGAGTITCNYDGFFKYRTVIGDGAFIGSNSALVAPVTIGAGAIVGAGSVVTKDVEPDALGIARAEQKGLNGWAARFRAKARAKKSGSSSA
ncbi:bifunctional UDP-N-acetylglucosamine diphosphorylase/glucosamine-1-phosphate N-acetyltransferase GlmU [Sphingomonas sp.]|uniref:bifunctional UDP-N-acetylglucosamine diphosphorylase/glucosamine-1-phosphate N-acetyltransferase GlmU n=1 Tax=Sphingomonas sp. TaxID=28214 RepID=UPI0025CE2A15|nr:bifunctional UDP-N-acetylglucosamine diphosphorylase/glucosamine-1-phosphate N-acetyltransferase GlmU [Sphingomonas sp.]